MSDLWIEATHDAEAEMLDQQVTAAKVAVSDLVPFLMGATSSTDYANRKAMVTDRLDAVTTSVLGSRSVVEAPLSPETFAVVRATLEARLDEDYATLAAQAAAERRVEEQVRARVQATLARQAAKQAAEICSGSGAKMANQGQRNTEDSKFFGKALGNCPVCGKRVRSKSNTTPRHSPEKTARRRTAEFTPPLAERQAANGTFEMGTGKKCPGSGKVVDSDTRTCPECLQPVWPKDGKIPSHRQPAKEGAKVAYTSDGSDITPNADALMSLQDQAYDAVGVNGFGGPDDPKRREVIEWIKSHLGPLKDSLTQADLDVAEDYNAHAAVQAAMEAKGTWTAAKTATFPPKKDENGQQAPVQHGTGTETQHKPEQAAQQPAEQPEAAAGGTVERKVEQDPATGEFVGSEWEQGQDPATLVQSASTFGNNPRFKTQEEATAWVAETGTATDTTKPAAEPAEQPAEQKPEEKKANPFAKGSARTASAEIDWQQAFRTALEDEGVDAAAFPADVAKDYYESGMTPERAANEAAGVQSMFGSRRTAASLPAHLTPRQAANDNCPTCKGTGSVSSSGTPSDDEVDAGYNPCPFCGGTGKVTGFADQASRKASLRTVAVAWGRRHYESLAEAISSLPDGEREQVARHFASALAGTNPLFNSSRFYDAASSPGYRVRGGTGSADFSRGHYQLLADTVASYSGDKAGLLDLLTSHLQGLNGGFKPEVFRNRAQGSRKTAGEDYWQVKGTGGQDWGPWYPSEAEADQALADLRERYRASGMSNLMPDPAGFTVQKVSSRHTASRRTASWIDAARDVVKNFQAQEVDGILLDLYSASAMVQVYDALNDANKAKFDAMSLPAAQDMAFKLIDKTTSVLHQTAATGEIGEGGAAPFVGEAPEDLISEAFSRRDDGFPQDRVPSGKANPYVPSPDAVSSEPIKAEDKPWYYGLGETNPERRQKDREDMPTSEPSVDGTNARRVQADQNPYSTQGNPYIPPQVPPGTPDDLMDGPVNPEPLMLETPRTTRPRQMPSGDSTLPDVTPPERTPL